MTQSVTLTRTVVGDHLAAGAVVSTVGAASVAEAVERPVLVAGVAVEASTAMAGATVAETTFELVTWLPIRTTPWTVSTVGRLAAILTRGTARIAARASFSQHSIV